MMLPGHDICIETACQTDVKIFWNTLQHASLKEILSNVLFVTFRAMWLDNCWPPHWQVWSVSGAPNISRAQIFSVSSGTALNRSATWKMKHWHSLAGLNTYKMMKRKWADRNNLTYQAEVWNLENRSLCIFVDCHDDLNLKSLVR